MLNANVPTLRTRYVIFLLVFSSIHFTCSPRKHATDPARKAVRSLLLKRNFSFSHAWHRSIYSLHRKPREKHPDTGKWVLTFSDEFDSLNLKKWRPGQPWGEIHPGNLHQYYDAEEVRVKNGILYLGGAYKPKKIRHGDSLLTVPYAIGLINSDISFRQKYGYFEIRSRNPSGSATWPAFWLTGADKWPPEIDIFEMYGRKHGRHIHHQYFTVHWGENNSRSRGFLARKVRLPRDTDTTFHTYACEWTPEKIRFFTDGKLVSVFRVGKRLRPWLDEEMVVIINNCFDTKYLKYLPDSFTRNDFAVDWIRVYKRR